MVMAPPMHDKCLHAWVLPSTRTDVVSATNRGMHQCNNIGLNCLWLKMCVKRKQEQIHTQANELHLDGVRQAEIDVVIRVAEIHVFA